LTASARSSFDGRSQSNYSALNQHFNIVNSNGALQSVNTDGITTKATALQNQVHYELDAGIKVDNNMRWTRMSSAVLGAVPQRGDDRSTTPEGGAIYYANGVNAGQLYTNRYLNNNTDVHTNINDVGSFANDLALSDRFWTSTGTLTTVVACSS
jgi:hypothetical protein